MLYVLLKGTEMMGDGHMILLHGFIKKTQKTPQQDIDLALKRKRELMG